MSLSRRLFVAGAALAPAVLARADDKPLVPMTGESSEKFALLDELMSLVITKPKLPGGAQLAVTQDGKVVYERGFAYADSDKKAEMKHTAVMRISSNSKPFTAVAVLQFVEKGKLSLDDKVLDVLKLKPLGTKPDERLKKITIRNLLEHRGGWDHSSKKKTDPTFSSFVVAKDVGVRNPAMPPAIVQYVLRKPLDVDPGEKFLYCNFGYLLLGRVIEKLSGASYAAHVKKNVLEPLGIKTMKLGKTLLADRAADEVRYHSTEKASAVMGPSLGKPVPAPYGGFCLESMDAHSAWLASAGDVTRFASHFHNPKTCKLLKADTVETMFARPENEDGQTFYAKGWMVRPIAKTARSFWHDGSMEGTSGMVVQRADGIGFTMLFNTRQQVDNTDPAAALELPMHKALNLVFAAKK